jgi:hypothetical protein
MQFDYSMRPTTTTASRSSRLSGCAAITPELSARSFRPASALSRWPLDDTPDLRVPGGVIAVRRVTDIEDWRIGDVFSGARRVHDSEPSRVILNRIAIRAITDSQSAGVSAPTATNLQWSIEYRHRHRHDLASWPRPRSGPRFNGRPWDGFHLLSSALLTRRRLDRPRFDLGFIRHDRSIHRPRQRRVPMAARAACPDLQLIRGGVR